MKPISIIGGGLAGLSLGHALVKAGTPTTITERGTYPRHRVCGEFIAGLRDTTVAALSLGPLLQDAAPRTSVTWFHHDRRIRSQRLSRPALAIGRDRLDLRLAQAFTRAGGILRTNTSVSAGEATEGTVYCHGRRREPSEWIGLKTHVRGLDLHSDLEFHLGDQAYVGICEVEPGLANVCGLFKRRPVGLVTRNSVLQTYLDQSGLAQLSDRVSASEVDGEACCAVAGLSFSRNESQTNQIYLGDAFAMIPPYTGNGMAMAFQSAAIALPRLVEWSQGLEEWEQTVARIQNDLTKKFSRRLALAAKLHPFLLQPTPQKLFSWANRTGFLPLRLLSGAVHA